jgi:hypothetical protein
MPWSSPLDFPITLRDGRVLRTLDDAGSLIVKLGTTRPGNAWDEDAAELLMKAASSGGEDAIEAATLQVLRVLTREGML